MTNNDGVTLKKRLSFYRFVTTVQTGVIAEHEAYKSINLC